MRRIRVEFEENNKLGVYTPNDLTIEEMDRALKSLENVREEMIKANGGDLVPVPEPKPFFNKCAKCMRDCKHPEKTSLCFKFLARPEDEICFYFGPECQGHSMITCSFWNGVCKCPQIEMMGGK